jgi:hypothetical protein
LKPQRLCFFDSLEEMSTAGKKTAQKERRRERTKRSIKLTKTEKPFDAGFNPRSDVRKQ